MKSLLSTLILGLSLLIVQNGIAQSKEEKALSKEAKAYFSAEDYRTAYKKYEKLLSQNPEEVKYKYHLGVCMIYTSVNLYKAIEYLKEAEKNIDGKVITPWVYFYLGKAYVLNYEFQEALGYFKSFQEKVKEKVLEKSNVAREIEMCENAERIMNSPPKAEILEQVNAFESSFLSEYKNLNEIRRLFTDTDPYKDIYNSNASDNYTYDALDGEGQLMLKPSNAFFNSFVDYGKDEITTIFVDKGLSNIYIPSYGQFEWSDKDIFIVKSMPDQNWSAHIRLGKTVNSDYDEDFPFVSGKGRVLFFSSKGFNSMGGYDIFKCTFDDSTNTWGAPENLGFPINSPYDDIVFAPDTTGSEAYFASYRDNLPLGQISVYKVKLEPDVVEFTIVDGKLIKNRTSQSSDIAITVFNLEDKTLVGVFKSNKANGEYAIALPNTSDRFLFQVKSPQFKTQSKLVVIPSGKTVNKVVAQEVKYNKVTGKLDVKFVKNSSEYGSTILANEIDSTMSVIDLGDGVDLNALAEEYKKEAGTIAVKAEEVRELMKTPITYANEQRALNKKVNRELGIANMLLTKLDGIANIKSEEALLKSEFSEAINYYSENPESEAALVQLRNLERRIYELELLNLDSVLLYSEVVIAEILKKQEALQQSVDYYNMLRSKNNEKINKWMAKIDKSRSKTSGYSRELMDNIAAARAQNKLYDNKIAKHAEDIAGLDKQYNIVQDELALFEPLLKSYKQLHEREVSKEEISNVVIDGGPTGTGSVSKSNKRPSSKKPNKSKTSPSKKNNPVIVNMPANPEDGLYYGVQVGYFSKAVPYSNFKGFNPLYQEEMPNGMMRYRIGLYNNYKQAKEARELLQEAGINGVFVTAFYGGKRITINQALELEGKNAAMPSSTPGMNIMPYTK